MLPEFLCKAISHMLYYVTDKQKEIIMTDRKMNYKEEKNSKKCETERESGNR